MTDTNLALMVDGKLYSGWESASFSHSLDSLSMNFSLEIHDESGGFETGIAEESECMMYALESQDNLNVRYELLSGVVMDTETEINQDGHKFTIAGNDKLIDLVDCSAIVDSSSWKKAKASKIIRDVCSPFDVTIDFSGLPDDFIVEDFAINTGDSPFSVIERICRFVGAIPIVDEYGELAFFTIGALTPRSEVPLVLGKNILSVRRTKTIRERRHVYIGKTAFTSKGKRWKSKELGINCACYDSSVTRYKPEVFVAESKQEKETLQRRVNWEAQVRAGRSVEYIVQVVDLFKRNGDNIIGPWRIGELVSLVVKNWGLNDEFIIAAVDMVINEQGRRTTLTLRDKATYAPNPQAQVEL